MPDIPAPSTPRVVPGAPPPAPLSKSQKKKRKGGAKTKEESEAGSHVAAETTAATPIEEKAAVENDVKEELVAPQLAVQPSEGDAVTPVGDHRATPIVDMLNKRLKANSKKITRIQNYQNEAPEKLNEDQKRLLKTLPALEAVSKELEEVKKAIEVHETEVAQELAFVKAEAARAQEERIRDAVAATQAEYLDKTAELVTFLRLHGMLSNRHPEAMALDLSEREGIAIYSITETLFHEILPGKTEMIQGIFTGEGEHLDIPYSRIREIQDRFLRPPTPQEKPIEMPEPEPAPVETPLVGGVPPTISTSGGIHFIMTDELAEAAVEAETQPEGNEWVDVQGPVDPEPAEVEVTETVIEAQVNGHTVVEDTLTITTTTEVPASVGQLNWADEDHEELPSLANLQAHYGTSGEATPVLEAEAVVLEPAEVNGQAPAVDDDGFTTTQRGGRGRGRGFRGERGGFRGERGHRGGFRGEHRGEHRGGRGGHRGEHGERGGYRGEHGERGGYRGEHGERGGYRGEHGERGGFRGEHGERGGFRGEHGERGGFRGDGGERGGRGGWRGGDRGFRGRPDGEWRGGRGGRGRGRGFPPEAQGGAPPAA